MGGAGCRCWCCELAAYVVETGCWCWVPGAGGARGLAGAVSWRVRRQGRCWVTRGADKGLPLLVLGASSARGGDCAPALGAACARGGDRALGAGAG